MFFKPTIMVACPPLLSLVDLTEKIAGVFSPPGPAPGDQYLMYFGLAETAQSVEVEFAGEMDILACGSRLLPVDLFAANGCCARRIAPPKIKRRRTTA